METGSVQAKAKTTSAPTRTGPDFSSPQLGQFNSIVGAKRFDEDTVILLTSKPYPALMAQLVKLSVVPEHVGSELGQEGFNEAPVGSGPYKLVSSDRGVKVSLHAFRPATHQHHRSSR